MPISQQFAWLLLGAVIGVVGVLLPAMVAVIWLRSFSYRCRHPRPVRTANEPRRGSQALADYYRGLSGGPRQ
jgi:hypothetical protein